MDNETTPEDSTLGPMHFIPKRPPPGPWTALRDANPPKDAAVEVRWIEHLRGHPGVFTGSGTAILELDPDGMRNFDRWHFSDKRGMPARLTDEWRLP